MRQGSTPHQIDGRHPLQLPPHLDLTNPESWPFVQNSTRKLILLNSKSFISQSEQITCHGLEEQHSVLLFVDRLFKDHVVFSLRGNI